MRILTYYLNSMKQPNYIYVKFIKKSIKLDIKIIQKITPQ
ncbi:hypothetical protein P186_0113 [Pyrobaculum ferrireducens]|uniref:Uncharacterized protein n=1 Tax=Pyrobaculum ferrireducens TaxID=1104324 RepID=G7VEF7_9CREN|nr:hypothetical protein P186_0113 [Pyrobaculum ferrireducens]